MNYVKQRVSDKLAVKYNSLSMCQPKKCLQERQTPFKTHQEMKLIVSVDKKSAGIYSELCRSPSDHSQSARFCFSQNHEVPQWNEESGQEGASPEIHTQNKENQLPNLPLNSWIKTVKQSDKKGCQCDKASGLKKYCGCSKMELVYLNRSNHEEKSQFEPIKSWHTKHGKGKGISCLPVWQDEEYQSESEESCSSWEDESEEEREEEEGLKGRKRKHTEDISEFR